jgi:hypothetical protein
MRGRICAAALWTKVGAAGGIVIPLIVAFLATGVAFSATGVAPNATLGCKRNSSFFFFYSSSSL